VQKAALLVRFHHISSQHLTDTFQGNNVALAAMEIFHTLHHHSSLTDHFIEWHIKMASKLVADNIKALP